MRSVLASAQNAIRTLSRRIVTANDSTPLGHEVENTAPEVDGAMPSGQPDRLQVRGAASDAVMSDENADEPSQLDRNREFTEGVLSGRSSTNPEMCPRDPHATPQDATSTILCRSPQCSIEGLRVTGACPLCIGEAYPSEGPDRSGFGRPMSFRTVVSNFFRKPSECATDSRS